MCLKSKMLLASSLLISGSAMAHSGDHGFSGILHFLSEPDHVAIMLGSGIAAGWLISKYVLNKKNSG